MSSYLPNLLTAAGVAIGDNIPALFDKTFEGVAFAVGERLRLLKFKFRAYFYFAFPFALAFSFGLASLASDAAAPPAAAAYLVGAPFYIQRRVLVGVILVLVSSDEVVSVLVSPFAKTGFATASAPAPVRVSLSQSLSRLPLCIP